MSPALGQPGQKRERRDRHVYSLKADEDIYRHVAKYQFLTAAQMTELTGRDHKTIQKRLQFLFEAGSLNRQQRDKLAPYVYFLAEKGGREAARLGFLPELRFIKGKSRILINHDLEITKFHLALEAAFPGQISKWEQWRGDLKDGVETERGLESLIPDARFVLNDQNFFLEVVKSYESEYEDGESNIFRKVALYNSYKNQFRKKYGGDDFRVLWVLPTKARVLGLLVKLEHEFPYRRFYVTDEESYKTNIQGNIWWTPKDFNDATYAITGQTS